MEQKSTTSGESVSLEFIKSVPRILLYVSMSLFELHLVRYDVDNLRKDLGVISKTVAQKMKDSKGADKCEEEKAQANAVKEKIELAEKQLEEVEAERTKKLNTIGNLVHTDVPISKDEANNKVAAT